MQKSVRLSSPSLAKSVSQFQIWAFPFFRGADRDIHHASQYMAERFTQRVEMSKTARKEGKFFSFLYVYNVRSSVPVIRTVSGLLFRSTRMLSDPSEHRREKQPAFHGVLWHLGDTSIAPCQRRRRSSRRQALAEGLLVDRKKEDVLSS